MKSKLLNGTKEKELKYLASMLKRDTAIVTLHDHNDVYDIFKERLKGTDFYVLNRNEKLVLICTNLKYIKKVLPDKIEFYQCVIDGVVRCSLAEFYILDIM